MNNPFSTILKSTRAAGVEVIFLPEKGIQLNIVLIKVNRGNLSIEKTLTGLDDIAVLKEHLPLDIPICLVFNGKGIIHKNVEITERDEDKTLVRKVIPNANIKDFYLQAQARIGGHGFVSIIRKAIADEVINALKSQGYFIVSVQLGAFSLVPIAALVDGNLKDKTSYELKNGGHNVTVHNGAIEEYLYDKTSASIKQEITIDHKAISSDATIALSAALGYLQSEMQMPKASIAEIENESEEFLQKKIFTTVGWGALVFFLGMLVINYFLLTTYSKKASEKEIEANQYAGIEKERERLEAEMNEKNIFIESMGVTESSNTSFYADRIVVSVPHDIDLSQLTIHPLAKKIKKDERIEFKNNVIMVEGECNKSKDLDDWVQNLKREYNWIKQLTVVGYSQNNSKEKGEFQLEINLK